MTNPYVILVLHWRSKKQSLAEMPKAQGLSLKCTKCANVVFLSMYNLEFMIYSNVELQIFCKRRYRYVQH